MKRIILPVSALAALGCLCAFPAAAQIAPTLATKCRALTTEIIWNGLKVEKRDDYEVSFTYPGLIPGSGIHLGCERSILFASWPGRRAPKHFIAVVSRAAQALFERPIPGLAGAIERCHNEAAIAGSGELDRSSGSVSLKCKSGLNMSFAIREK